MIATLFDFDGVLVDSEPVHLAAFNDVLASSGIVITEHDYAEHYLALDDAGVFREVLIRSGRTLREEEVRTLVAAKGPRFMARFEQTFRAYPGATELVARRAARGPVGIVSGALAREVAFALGRMGVGEHVAFVVSAESTPDSKPHPAPFLRAVQMLGDGGFMGRAVVVEDSIGGVKSAKAAGLRCVAVAHTYPVSELRAAGADAAVLDLASITDAMLESDS